MILAPPISIGFKVEELVYANVVNPAKVTVVPVLRDSRLMELFVGTLIPSRTIFVQAATAGAICAYTVAVHDTAVLVDELLIDVEVELKTEDELVLELLEVADVLVEVDELVG